MVLALTAPTKVGLMPSSDNPASCPPEERPVTTSSAGILPLFLKEPMTQSTISCGGSPERGSMVRLLATGSPRGVGGAASGMAPEGPIGIGGKAACPGRSQDHIGMPCARWHRFRPMVTQGQILCWHCLVDEYTPILIEKHLNALEDHMLKVQVTKEPIVFEHVHHLRWWLCAATLNIPLLPGSKQGSAQPTFLLHAPQKRGHLESTHTHGYCRH